MGGRLMDPGDVMVLIPNDLFGLTVCTLEDPWLHVDEAEDVEELIMNAGIDQTLGDPTRIIEKVKAFNRTGDSDAYWGLTTT
jgi:hypothetical protein